MVTTFLFLTLLFFIFSSQGLRLPPVLRNPYMYLTDLLPILNTPNLCNTPRGDKQSV